MNLYLRLLHVLLTNKFRERLHYSSFVESSFRVWPHDLDAFGHMNNGRYLQIMDVARLEWMARTGAVSAILQNRWAPILGGGLIRFRYSLRLMQAFRVRTRLLCWDRRWFFLEHTFQDDAGRCISVGVTRAGLRLNGSWVHTTEAIASICPGAQSPEIPNYLYRWLRLENDMFKFGANAVQSDALEIT